jgi:hypothetical protein
MRRELGRGGGHGAALEVYGLCLSLARAHIEGLETDLQWEEEEMVHTREETCLLLLLWAGGSLIEGFEALLASKILEFGRAIERIMDTT